MFNRSLSKVGILQSLSDELQSASVLPIYSFKAKLWQSHQQEVLTAFFDKHTWSTEPLIVRSSGSNEDNKDQSLAGHYCSILNVESRAELIEAVNCVNSSFRQMNNDDEIFIQAMLPEVEIAGVVFTQEPSTNAPYYVINFDTSGSTESVTSGETNKLHTTYIAKSQDSKIKILQWHKDLLNLCQELESKLSNSALDIEFAFNKQMQLFLFQVRPLVITEKVSSNKHKTSNSIDEQQALLKETAGSIKRLSQPHPYLFGKKSIFGVMPDWNPAEIIGIRPRPLALSLYKELITDAIWAYQRDNYGYQKLRSFPLLVNFYGLPYIDVRVSFNSFIPAETEKKLAEKLVNFYIKQLEENPEKHDKVEFDIIYSCYTLDIDDKLKKLASHQVTDLEISNFKQALRSLTNEIISVDGLWQRDIKKIDLLPDRNKKILSSELPTLDKIYWLLEDCKRYGTLPFAGLARAGFIAVQLLRSLVTVGVLTENEYHAFMASLNTVSSQMAKDRQDLSTTGFLDKYGHLRPGTYDINSPRYDKTPGKYFSKQQAVTTEKASRHFVTDKFALTLEQLEQLEALLSQHGLSHDVISLFRFIKGAIEGREYAKFIFTQNLSDAIELFADLGQENNIDRDAISYMDASIIKQLYSNANDRKNAVVESIVQGKKQYRQASKLILPPLICDEADIYCFQQPESSPNFITLKSIEAASCKEQLSPELVQGKIVFIPSADPGFDWLFANNIAGLITQFGGVNSHMAIRAGELGIPAVIGAGQLEYDRWEKANYLRIDAANKQVHIIS